MFSTDGSPFPYLEFVVNFVLLVNVFHVYLDVRQLKAIRLPNPPPQLAGTQSQQPRTHGSAATSLACMPELGACITSC